MTRPAEAMRRKEGQEPAGGPLHLLKMAVGVASLEELRQMRAQRIERLGGSWVYTRNYPRRGDAVLGGGSLYWVIRGQIRVRQRITGFGREHDDPTSSGRGRAYCLIGVDPELVPTLWRPWRPFQGWRYLTPADAPPDLTDGALTDGEVAWESVAADAEQPMPERLLAELRSLGLL